MKSNKGITGKQLKNWLDKLSEEELDNYVVFLSEEFSLSLPILEVKQARYNLLWDGEDDPSTLRTRNWFLKEGYDKEEVDEFTIEINKGDIIISHK